MFSNKKNYFLNLCLIIMLLSVIMGMNSMTWLMMWMSMEMTLMFFIPRLMLNKSMMESFSSLKYFIFQCLGSIFFILGSLDFFFFFNSFGLLMKLGLFPNHFWMLMVSKGLNWLNFFMLMTIQKILPFLFFIYSMKYMLFLFLILIYFNSLIGNLGSLNQMDLRFLMVFSSMNHMSWMIMSSNYNNMYMYIYMFFYMILLYLMYLYFNMYNIYYMFQIFYLKNLSFNMNLTLIFLTFFSFMGFPPLMGFFLKFISIFFLINFMFSFFLLLILMQNLIITFSYMRTVIYLFMNMSRSMKMGNFNFKNYSINFFIFFFFLII